MDYVEIQVESYDLFALAAYYEDLVWGVFEWKEIFANEIFFALDVDMLKIWANLEVVAFNLMYMTSIETSKGVEEVICLYRSCSQSSKIEFSKLQEF